MFAVETTSALETQLSLADLLLSPDQSSPHACIVDQSETPGQTLHMTEVETTDIESLRKTLDDFFIGDTRGSLWEKDYIFSKNEPYRQNGESRATTPPRSSQTETQEGNSSTPRPGKYVPPNLRKTATPPPLPKGNKVRESPMRQQHSPFSAYLSPPPRAILEGSSTKLRNSGCGFSPSDRGEQRESSSLAPGSRCGGRPQPCNGPRGYSPHKPPSGLSSNRRSAPSTPASGPRVALSALSSSCLNARPQTPPTWRSSGTCSLQADSPSSSIQDTDGSLPDTPSSLTKTAIKRFVHDSRATGLTFNQKKHRSPSHQRRSERRLRERQQSAMSCDPPTAPASPYVDPWEEEGDRDAATAHNFLQDPCGRDAATMQLSFESRLSARSMR
uniref:Uncharacterized protein n=1 Tax=Tetraselmis sp. GSL018 TaxID=582737 RepID=A0A061S0X3_9CHLO|mmetsp:Transcript_14379/g.34066  ORF Transcript_14379/g.34066 Transcript_14379/m.34066 type:complete len:387 (+) Transcript_14379:136-1296(+)